MLGPKQTPKNDSHEELINQLTRLNNSLQLELEQCHKQIECLKSDLKQAEIKHPILQTPNEQILERQVAELRSQLQRSNNKVKQKRNQVKKLQKSILNVEGALQEVIKEKQQLLQRLYNLQYGANTNTKKSMVDQSIQKADELKPQLSEQKRLIQFYIGELQYKDNLLQKLSQNIQILEKQLQTKQKQIHDFNQVNYNLTNQIQQKHRQNQQIRQENHKINMELNSLQKQNHQNLQKTNSQIKQLQNKNLQAVNQLNRVGLELQASKKTKTDLDASCSSRVSILSSPRGDARCWPVTKRISIDEHAAKKKQQDQKQQLINDYNILYQQFNIIKQERSKENSQASKLKSDLVNMKIEYSNLLSRNNQLIQANVKLERQKNQLFLKLQEFKAGKLNPTSMEKSLEGSQKCINRSFVTIARTNTIPGTFSSNRINLPNDGEVPVRDRNSIRASNVCTPQQKDANIHQLIQPRKNNVFIRPNVITFSSLK